MRRTAVQGLLVLGIAWSGVAAGDTPFLVGGIQVHEQDHERWTRTLHEVGLNTVAVTVYAKQGIWDRAHLWWEENEPAVVDEIRAAKSRGLFVVLILRVAVDHAFEENRFIWHGMIMPDSPDEIRAWFARYGEFVVKWAGIAESEGVDLLGVGSEMKALTATREISRRGNLRNYYGYYWYQRSLRERARKFAEEIDERHLWVRGFPHYATLDEFVDARFEHTMAWARQAHLRPGAHTLRRINDRRRLLNDCWIGLIDETRKVFSGRLTYAANFDNYRNVGFWRHLDVMGINSYFSLRGNLSEGAEQAEQLELFTGRWDEILARIRAFKQSRDIAEMPVVFTELGYTFRRHSTVEPWNHGGFAVVGWKGRKKQFVVWSEQPIDHDERRLALVALRTAHLRAESDLTGILYWKLSTQREHEEIEPFVCHIGRDSIDALQEALAAFASGTACELSKP